VHAVLVLVKVMPLGGGRGGLNDHCQHEKGENKKEACHGLHVTDKTPKGLGLVVHDAENWGEEVVHALDVTEVKIEEGVRDEDVVQHDKVVPVFVLVVRMLAVGAHHVLFNAVLPLPEFGKVLLLKRRDARPLLLDSLIFGPRKKTKARKKMKMARSGEE